MEYVNYLIYPIAAILAFLAIGGIATKHPIVVASSVVSLALNIYAIFSFQWWPIIASIVVDFGFKRLFGDPGQP